MFRNLMNLLGKLVIGFYSFLGIILLTFFVIPLMLVDDNTVWVRTGIYLSCVDALFLTILGTHFLLIAFTARNENDLLNKAVVADRGNKEI